MSCCLEENRHAEAIKFPMEIVKLYTHYIIPKCV